MYIITGLCNKDSNNLSLIKAANGEHPVSICPAKVFVSRLADGYFVATVVKLPVTVGLLSNPA